MVKFVAKEGVNFESLEELELLGLGVDTDISKTKSDGFVVKDDDTKIKVGGNGFDYILDVPFTGKITDVDVFVSGDLAYSLSKLKLKISDLLTIGDLEDAVKTIFKGDDKLIGSNDKDTLIGFKGDDTIKGNKGSDNLVGDKGDDVLKGGKGKDLLDGGKGDDELDGGGGIDSYAFTAAPGKGVDKILDFEAGEKFLLDGDVFSVGSSGELSEALFRVGSNATTDDHRIIYKEDKGRIFYDDDGEGGDDKVLFAKVTSAPELEASDFFVI